MLDEPSCILLDRQVGVLVFHLEHIRGAYLPIQIYSLHLMVPLVNFEAPLLEALNGARISVIVRSFAFFVLAQLCGRSSGVAATTFSHPSGAI